MTGSSRVSLPELPSLTGLRYWAAFSILLNHLLLGFVSRDNPYFATMLSACGTLGMNVFFVLSGFIIHYNYHHKLDDFRMGSFYEFMVARFSRLYPLYIMVFFVEFLTTHIGKYSIEDVFRSLFFFGTMSHSWIYWKLDSGQSLTYMYDRFSISWSISTEFLMYCGYPALLWLFVRDGMPNKRRIFLSLAVCLACSVFIRWMTNNMAMVDQWGIALFGERASLATNASYSFAFWLTYLSPYIRFFEFIIGAVTAHNFLRLRDVPIGPREGLLMPLAGLLSFFFILATFIPKDAQPAMISATYNALGYFPFIAMVIFVCARYDFSVVTKFFEVRFFVFFGECSYSMYLIHIFIYSMAQHGPATPLADFLRIPVLWATVFACSYVLYTLLEMPARRRLRDALTRKPAAAKRNLAPA